jgi:hypothetical protein
MAISLRKLSPGFRFDLWFLARFFGGGFTEFGFLLAFFFEADFRFARALFVGV